MDHVDAAVQDCPCAQHQARLSEALTRGLPWGLPLGMAPFYFLVLFYSFSYFYLSIRLASFESKTFNLC